MKFERLHHFLVLLLVCQFSSSKAKLGETLTQEMSSIEAEDAQDMRTNLDEAFPKLHLRDQERNLQELVYHGGKPDSMWIPLGLCEGDCDEDKDVS